MAVALPKLTDEERRAALEKAAQARQVRAEVKRELRRGTASMETVLQRSEEDEALAKMKVLDLLQSLPGVGAVTARETMARLRIAQSRRLRGLGTNQRQALVQEFDR